LAAKNHNVHLTKTSRLIPITSALLKGDGITHGFFTRQQGVSNGLYNSLNAGFGSKDKSANVAQNRALIAHTLGLLPQNCVTPYQIHSAKTVRVETPWPHDQAPEADSLVTNQPHIGLGILTADCGPVLFADRKAGVIGCAHAGWKGALGGVLESTLETMESLGSKRENITAALGPMIGFEAYEVGPEFYEQFISKNCEYEAFFKSSDHEDHFLFNLPGFIAYRLTCAGLQTLDNVSQCTYRHQDLFFSYRRSVHQKEKDYGRLLSMIAMT
jgi:YfiH family protein